MCPWPGPSFAEAGKPFGAPITAETLTDLDAHHWELYHVAEDPAENHNLAAEHRDKLESLTERLMEKETLDMDEAYEAAGVARPRVVPPEPAAVVD